MTTKINVKKSNSLISPKDMISNNFKHGTIFQLYVNGQPLDDFFVHCGLNEKKVVHLWKPDKDEWQMSTSDLDELSDYLKHVKVKEIDADLNILLELK